MSAVPGVSFARVLPADAPDVVAFFERVGQPCFCRYWHFEGDKNGWQARLVHTPDENARELTEDLRTPELHGIVAREASRGVVGWMKLTRAERVQKLYAQRLYKGLPCFAGDRSDVFTVGCFLVDPEFRRLGVARGLLSAGLEFARAAGARVVEAFPRRAEMLGDEEAWMGPYGLLTAQGFEVVHDFGPYPVLRCTFD